MFPINSAHLKANQQAGRSLFGSYARLVGVALAPGEPAAEAFSAVPHAPACRHLLRGLS